MKGVLLDVRYWGKQRSASEIKRGMRRLIRMLKNEDGSDVSSAVPILVRKSNEKGNGDGLPDDGKNEGEVGAHCLDGGLSALTIGTSKVDLTPTPNANQSEVVEIVQHEDLSSNGLIGWWAFEDGGIVSKVESLAREKKETIKKDKAEKKELADLMVDDDLLSLSRTLSLSEISPLSPTKVEVSLSVDTSDKKKGFVARSRSRNSINTTVNDSDGTTKQNGASDLRKNRVADVADHRFPSLIQQVIAPLAFSPPLLDSSIFGSQSTAKEAGIASLSSSETKLKAESIRSSSKKKVLLFDPAPALQRWSVSGGDGLKWRWLDATYLSSLSHLTAAAVEIAANAAGYKKKNSVATNYSSLSTLPDVPVPVPSYMSAYQCPFEIKKNRLAQLGRALQEEIPCPAGHLKSDATDVMECYQLMRFVINLKYCVYIHAGCREMVRRIDIRHHVKEQCERRLVSCIYEGCIITFAAGDREDHETLYCKFFEHRERLIEESLIGRAVVTCRSCSEQMSTRSLKAHRKDRCPHRYIPCLHDDCTDTFQAHELERHLKFNCSSVSCMQLILILN
jgi:hypothetical protein